MSEKPDIEKKDGKNPIESAANKLREGFNKEWQGKLEGGIKSVISAQEVRKKAEQAEQAEKDKLAELRDDYEKSKAEFNTLIKEIA